MNAQLIDVAPSSSPGALNIQLTNVTPEERQFVENFIALMSDPQYDRQRHAFQDGKTCILWAGRGALNVVGIMNGGGM